MNKGCKRYNDEKIMFMFPGRLSNSRQTKRPIVGDVWLDTELQYVIYVEEEEGIFRFDQRSCRRGVMGYLKNSKSGKENKFALLCSEFRRRVKNGRYKLVERKPD